MTATLNISASQHAQGFTTIEFLSVVALVAILALIGVVQYSSFERSVNVTTVTDEIVDTLYTARQKAVNSDKASSFGVHFESDKYILFRGSEYGEYPADNATTTLSDSVVLTPLQISGSSTDIVFNRITGTIQKATTTSIIGVQSVYDSDNNRRIAVLLSGHVGLDDTFSPANTRIADARHLHFDLESWSIQGSGTLTFTFSKPFQPDEVINIDMTTFFNGPQTVFDWEGTLTAFSENQTLKVHTHYLDAFDTTLCIHRDGRENSMAVNLSIDGNDIVFYDAAGLPTVGLFGGTMTAQ